MSAHSFLSFMAAVLGISEVHVSVPCSEALADVLSMNSSMYFLNKKTSTSVASRNSP